MKINLLIFSHCQFKPVRFPLLPAVVSAILLISGCKKKEQTEAARYADIKKSLA
jgi:hypothetical protein